MEVSTFFSQSPLKRAAKLLLAEAAGVSPELGPSGNVHGPMHRGDPKQHVAVQNSPALQSAGVLQSAKLPQKSVSKQWDTPVVKPASQKQGNPLLACPQKGHWRGGASANKVNAAKVTSVSQSISVAVELIRIGSIQTIVGQVWNAISITVRERTKAHTLVTSNAVSTR